jgi:class 3 adenylate cyclase
MLELADRSEGGSMSGAAWLAAGAAAVAIIGGAFAAMRWILQKGFDARIEKLEARFEHQQLVEFRERWQPSTAIDRPADRIQREIDAELTYVMKMLHATESSLLIPDPAPNSSSLVFLSIYGPAASQLHRSKVGPASTAGLVLRTGEPKILSNPSKDPSFSPVVDSKSGHVTRNMLTIPLRAGTGNRVVGVAQFLNKIGDEGFTEDDARTAIVNTATIAMKTDELMRDPENLKSLGFHISSDEQEATLLFCDLSASAVLFQVLDAPGAINCIDEYLTRQTDVAFRHGGILDKYLGDGAMFRFNAFLEARSPDHAVRAAEAALEMRLNFKTLKDSWLSIGWEVGSIFSRSGLATGPVYEALIGPRMSRQVAVMGETVNRAAHLCELAARDSNLIIIDQALKDRIDASFTTRPALGLAASKNASIAYELVGPNPASTGNA